ncbi:MULTISPECIES: phage tail protein I [unclassified Undibacterium]|uniref:phage tail protein I n=1 Tax=unclassified Undibacterium TaxID=2630295 RepID=UPI002AC9BA2B|nr:MULTISPECIES: phage tail protein I [unclassified Undibacterium]MEB0137990.1 phage tail protein I [Undibacterium sp. CCC2.1]MEB0170677.1 phage tail protein I [Undibacterium sp. CCC1.1]MEB0177018.1 phage tail protein I [Undibacterium sp. CCC3.4]MEB0216307.1 phage tail protein I [Undibacterium sp. 5I2]WPX42491.1 phage tail protein I [Undibacterium sp. CCC3.4]
MTRSLLPPNASTLERALEQSSARLGDIPFRLRDNWQPERCPSNLLPWLAWAVGVEEWDSNWPESMQRDVIASARRIRQQKGTPAAVKRALLALGHPNAHLLERSDANKWATFKIILTRPVSIKQAELIKLRINQVKRNCCHLTALDFTCTPIKYNATIKYDGSYSHGMV